MRPGRGFAIGLAVAITVAAGSIAAASVVSIRDEDRTTGTFSPVAPTGASAGSTTTMVTLPSGTPIGDTDPGAPVDTTAANPAPVAPTPRAAGTSTAGPTATTRVAPPATVTTTVPPAPTTTTEPGDDDDDRTTTTTEPDDD